MTPSVVSLGAMGFLLSLIALLVGCIAWSRSALLARAVDDLTAEVDAVGTRVVELERRLGTGGCRACSPTTRLVRGDRE